MKKNHPERKPEAQRRSTVRPDRVYSGRAKQSNAVHEVIRGEAYRANNGMRRFIILSAVILVLLIAIPVSCRMLIPSDNSRVSSQDSLTDVMTFSDSVPSITTSGSDLTEGTDNSSDYSEPNSDTSSSDTGVSSDPTDSLSSTSTTESITIPVETINYPRADSNLLPEIKKLSSEELSAVSTVRYGWSFNRPDRRNEDLPASLPVAIEPVIEPYAVVWQLPATDKPTVYLTMDEGYEYADNTTRILDVALEKKVGITFFITGSFIDKQPDLVRRMAAEGHQVANHTVNHPDMSLMYNEQGAEAVMQELHGLEMKYKEVTGLNMPRLVRPPMGAFSPAMLAYLNNEGYYPVFWSFAYVDWLIDKQPVPTAALDQILGELHDGSVILIHAVSKTNTEILPELIDGIRTRGYEISLLPEP